jgi:excinuclease ABC subunit C
MAIKERLRKAPSSPGIYIMKSVKDKTIYVGKSKHLRNRLRSYFQPSASLGARISKMVKEIKDFDYIVTKNELEALVLEANYIKRLKPKYNIVLRDDKNYPFLKLDISENWPRLEVIRRTGDKNSLYFGPYIPAGTMWEILRFIRKNFLLRTCKYNLEKPMRPCVQYQMKRCLAPCSATRRTGQYKEEYDETVREVKLFLQGEKRELLSHLRNQMKRLSDNLRFEEAAHIRDRLKMIEKAWEPQRVVTPELGDMDVIGLHRAKECASVFIFFIRNGMVIGQKDFFLNKIGEIQTEGLIESFLEQFYSKEIPIPPRIIIPSKTRFNTIREWLNEKRGKTVRLSQARSDNEKKMYRMAEDNAFYSFSMHKESRVDETILSLRDLLRLKNLPARICAIDISNISGAESVGAIVVWENGEFIKDDYRLFRIKTIKGIDDFAMIGEVAGRYFKKISGTAKSAGENEKPPDLVLIDGGKGQLMSAIRAMKPFALPVELAAIAKAKVMTRTNKLSSKDLQKIPDRIYLPGRRDAFLLEPATASTHLLQRIRDEAHRFAVNYHKNLRSKRTLESPLEKVRGIGNKRRLLLLRHFGSISSIKIASVDELADIKGMNRKVAIELKRSLKG